MVKSIAVLPTEELIASGGREVLLWDARTGAFLRKLDVPDRLLSAGGRDAPPLRNSSRPILASTSPSCPQRWSSGPRHSRIPTP